MAGTDRRRCKGGPPSAPSSPALAAGDEGARKRVVVHAEGSSRRPGQPGLVVEALGDDLHVRERRPRGTVAVRAVPVHRSARRGDLAAPGRPGPGAAARAQPAAPSASTYRSSRRSPKATTTTRTQPPAPQRIRSGQCRAAAPTPVQVRRRRRLGRAATPGAPAARASAALGRAVARPASAPRRRARPRRRPLGPLALSQPSVPDRGGLGCRSSIRGPAAPHRGRRGLWRPSACEAGLKCKVGKQSDGDAVVDGSDFGGRAGRRAPSPAAPAPRAVRAETLRLGHGG